jgi:hypothetical protein
MVIAGAMTKDGTAMAADGTATTDLMIATGGTVTDGPHDGGDGNDGKHKRGKNRDD